jgi:hypothetical protein
MDEESVAVLITHALLQNGPFAVTDGKALIYSWCPESHQQLLEDHFVDELIVRLERHLKDFECNWQNELILIILTVVAGVGVLIIAESLVPTHPYPHSHHIIFKNSLLCFDIKSEKNFSLKFSFQFNILCSA